MKTKKKDKLYILSIKNKEGIVTNVLTSTNYDALIVEGMDLAKEVNGTWSIHNSYGKEVNGSI